MARKRYNLEEAAIIVMVDKDPVGVNLESSFESDISSAEEDLNQPIISESDSDPTYVSGSSNKSESCNNEEFSETISIEHHYV